MTRSAWSKRGSGSAELEGKRAAGSGSAEGKFVAAGLEKRSWPKDWIEGLGMLMDILLSYDTMALHLGI